MMKNLLMRPALLFLLFFTVSGIFSQARVTGKVPGAQGYVIRLITFGDLMTKLEKTVALDTIDGSGEFLLEAGIDRVTYAMIDIDFQRVEIYLSPGDNLEIVVNFDPEHLRKPYYDREHLDYYDYGEGSHGLNRVIRDVNVEYNSFILGHFEEIYRNRKKYLVDTLDNRLGKILQGFPSGYAEDYVRYKMASLIQAARMMGRDNLAEKYLSGKPVLYDNAEYMYFFGQFFDKYLLNNSGAFNLADILVLFDENRPVEDFLSLVRTDSLLSGKRLSELFLLSNLMALYGHPDIPEERIFRLISDIQATSPFPENRQIAVNLLARLRKLKPGTPAPGFVLTGPGEVKYSLKNFSGKYLYLGFFQAGNRNCTRELELLRPFYETFGERIGFLFVSVDKNLEDLEHLAAGNDYPWPLAHYANDVSLLENYDATTFPQYVLIDPEGNIKSCPAPGPGEQLERLLYRLIR